MPERVPQDTLRYGRLLTCLLKRLLSSASGVLAWGG